MRPTVPRLRTFVHISRPSQKLVDHTGRSTCINVHAKGRSTARSTARESLLFRNSRIDRAVDWQKMSALCIEATVDRWLNGQKSDRWLVNQAVDRQQSRLLTRPPMVIFWSLFIWGSLALFSTRFKESFWANFSYPYQWFYPHVLEPIFPNQKESLSRVLKSDFLSFSPPI